MKKLTKKERKIIVKRIQNAFKNKILIPLK